MEPALLDLLTRAVSALARDVAKNAASEVVKDTWGKIKKMLGFSSDPAEAELSLKIAEALQANEKLTLQVVELLQSQSTGTASKLVETISVDKGTVTLVGTNTGTINNTNIYNAPPGSTVTDGESKQVAGSVDTEKAVIANKIDTVIVGGTPQPSSSAATAQTPPRNLPSRNPRFVGRQAELADLHQKLNKLVEVGVTQQAAAWAQGGVGKTSIANEYAWLHLDDYPGGAFIISCDTDQLLPAVVELAMPLGLAECETPEQTAASVKAKLEAGPPSLLILDNVRSADQWGDRSWRALLPSGECRRLITTRAPFLPDVEMYQIERLPRDQGIELLAKYRDDAAEEGNAQIVGDIVDWFDGLAVGLTVVGVYMTLNPELDWAKYADSLTARGLGAVRATEDAVGQLPDYEKRVDSVFDDAIDALSQEQRRALEYAVLLPEDTVVRSWLEWLLENDTNLDLQAAPGYEDNPSRKVISDLVTLGLLDTSRGGQGILAVHRVLRRRAGEILDEQPKQRDALLDSVVAMAEERGEASKNAVTKPELQSELTSLVTLAGELEEAGRLDAAVGIADRIFAPLYELGRYSECRTMLTPMVKRYESDPDCIAPDEQGALSHNLALVLKNLGDLPEARRLTELAIEIQKKHFDTDHLILAASYSSLAMILQTLGDLPTARRRMERAIAIQKKHLDADHPNLATNYSNLAIILNDVGDIPEARRLVERAIKIDEKHFDADYPTLAPRYSNLAMILKALGDLPKARQLTERAIEIQKKHFGTDHPNLATAYSNLGTILHDLGELPEARLRTAQAIEIAKKHFKPDHPSLVRMRTNLVAIIEAEKRA